MPLFFQIIYLFSTVITIETKQQEKFQLSVTAASIESTDERFTMDNLSLGDNYKPLDAYFKKADGTVVKRSYSKGERRNTNQTMPRIACQIFEKQISAFKKHGEHGIPKTLFPASRYHGTILSSLRSHYPGFSPAERK